MGYMTYWSITAQQERRCSQRKGQRQIRAICSQPRIWAAYRTGETSTTSFPPAHFTLKGNQEICCMSVDLVLQVQLHMYDLIHTSSSFKLHSKLLGCISNYRYSTFLFSRPRCLHHR